MSLVVADDSWDPKTWITNVQNIKQDLYQLDIQLSIAKQTYNEFFKEIE